MLFHEIYGNYYNTIASILDKALEKPLDKGEIGKIVEEKAFGESGLVIPEELSINGKWPFLDEEGRALIHKKTSMPLTNLQKRWMKSLLLDPRIKLFSPKMEGLEAVEPLFHPEDFVYYDRFLDGDPFEDEHYIRVFQKILSAIKNHRSVRLLYQLKNGSDLWITCTPVRLEYSQRDDKFRVISWERTETRIINLAKVMLCQLGEAFEVDKENIEIYEKHGVELLLRDERNTLERAMLQFSIYEKITERLDEDTYKICLKYEAEDETELIIKILGFGPTLKVLGPETFVRQIKNRLLRQKRCGW